MQNTVLNIKILVTGVDKNFLYPPDEVGFLDIFKFTGAFLGFKSLGRSGTVTEDST